jgi:ketosteroid isomerase-like protein
MSQENVELARAAFAALNRGDLDALTQFYDPDVVFETLLLGTHRGNEAIRLLYEEGRKTLSGYAIDPIELRQQSFRNRDEAREAAGLSE